MARFKTRIEIASEFGISRKTLARWLKKENIELSNRLVGPSEQMTIYSRFGRPKMEHTSERENRKLSKK